MSNGLRDGGGPNPDADLFAAQHQAYVAALQDAGLQITQLPANEEFPDSVFVEDAAICLRDAAIALRPGAPSRFAETALIQPALKQQFGQVIDLPGSGFVDGGDVLLSDNHAFIGQSKRTNQQGFDALAEVLTKFNYHPIKVETPADILHFKTECGLLDSNTIFATGKLATNEGFKDYNIVEVPFGEEGAANIVRINEAVFISDGYPKSHEKLRDLGYKVVILNTSEAAKIDGGLSCMSLRF